MPVLDFKEIPQANLATGQQDTFELFSRDFLDYSGYKIISGPDRGQDNGIDILVEECRVGPGGDTKVRWLVSCKHFAHRDSGRGKAVGTDDEFNVADRIFSNGCNGFIGFYSTLASSGLSSKLEGLQREKRVEVQIFDHEKIEKKLLERQEGIRLAKRFFPKSIKDWNWEYVEGKVENIEKYTCVREQYYQDYLRRKRNAQSQEGK